MLSYTKTFSSFSVDDLQRARTFYGELLGLSIKESPEGLDVQLNGGGSLFIYLKENHQPATFTVLNFIVDDVDRAVADLKQSGVTFEMYDELHLKTDEQGIARGHGPTIAWFKDPAGNFLSVLKP